MFLCDLKKGNKTELLFTWLYCEKIIHNQQIKSIFFCSNSSFDVEIITDKSTITFEIKDDIKSITTGNICIEYEGRNNVKSGITKTISDYYVFKSGDEFLIFKTSILKKYCKENTHKTFSINNASFYLIDKESLLKNVKNYILKINKKII